MLNYVYIQDAEGNVLRLYGETHSLYNYYPDQRIPDKYKDLTITITRNGKTPDLTTSTTSGTLADDITNKVTDNGEEERSRMSVVGREKIYATLGIENKYAITIQNSIQGPLCFDVFNFVKGDYTIKRSSV